MPESAFLFLGSTIKTSTGPSPPKKLKVTKTESFKAAEDPEWVEQVEELKRKVIPPSAKVSAKVVAPTAKTAVKKTSVFDRLGESSVTSTTPEIPEPSSVTPAKVLTVLDGSIFVLQLCFFF